MRRIITAALFALAISTLPALGADNSIGTWKLNPAKSKYTPGPSPLKAFTVTREATEGGVKVTNVGERTDGAKVDASYTAKFDGKEVSVSGSGSRYDMVSMKQSDPNTFEEERRSSSGPYKATARIKVSNDGKTMTTTARGTNADGKPFTSTFVFEKQ